MRQNRRPAVTYDRPTKRRSGGVGILPTFLLALVALVGTFALAAVILGPDKPQNTPTGASVAASSPSSTPVDRTTPQGALAMLWDAWSLAARPEREQAMAAVCQPNAASILSAQQLKAHPVGEPKITTGSFNTQVEQRMSDKTTLLVTLIPEGDEWTVQAVTTQS